MVRGEEGSRGNKASVINMKITYLMDSVTVIMSVRVCLGSKDVRAVVLLGLHYKGKDRHCLALLLMDDVVMDRSWVTDRTPDGERDEGLLHLQN